MAYSKWCKKTEKWLKPWHMGTHLRVISKSYSMNTNMTGFRGFSKVFTSFCFGPKVVTALVGLIDEFFPRLSDHVRTPVVNGLKYMTNHTRFERTNRTCYS